MAARAVSFGMGRFFWAVAWCAFAISPVSAENAVAFPSSAAAANSRVHAFYYPWYGNPENDGRWIHWDQGGHTPPDDIGANFYPALGAYSSSDPEVLDLHCYAMSRVKIGVAVTSWWGQGSREDQLVDDLLEAAANNGVSVAFHIEPYGGRSAASVVDDIRYIYARYGGHPAFHRARRSTRWGPSGAWRGVFYVFESSGGGGAIPNADWRRELDAIRGTSSDAIVIGQTLDVSKIDGAHFDGLYNYDVYGVDGSEFASAGVQLRALNSIFSPSVGPGYVDTRAIPGSSRDLARDGGARYDLMWSRAVNASPDWVSISTFNEWHEGSQIEPAIPFRVGGYTYRDFTGDYGCRRTYKCAISYLVSTARWVRRL